MRTFIPFVRHEYALFMWSGTPCPLTIARRGWRPKSVNGARRAACRASSATPYSSTGGGQGRPPHMLFPFSEFEEGVGVEERRYGKLETILSLLCESLRSPCLCVEAVPIRTPQSEIRTPQSRCGPFRAGSFEGREPRVPRGVPPRSTLGCQMQPLRGCWGGTNVECLCS